MKIVRNTLAALALSGLAIAQPIAAQAAGPAPRVAASAEQGDNLHSGVGIGVGILAIFAAIILIGEATGAFHIFGHDDHPPVSP